MRHIAVVIFSRDICWLFIVDGELSDLPVKHFLIYCSNCVDEAYGSVYPCDMRSYLPA